MINSASQDELDEQDEHELDDEKDSLLLENEELELELLEKEEELLEKELEQELELEKDELEDEVRTSSTSTSDAINSKLPLSPRTITSRFVSCAAVFAMAGDGLRV